MSELDACVKSIGVLGPGIADWPAAAAILRGDADYSNARTLLPAPSVLPPVERRRAGRTIRLVLGIGAEAVSAGHAEARTLRTVFSSSGGDGDNCHEICMTLASEERQVSPTRFTNSVHNAAAGYWSIAYGCQEASTALCANDASFSAGLLEAVTQLQCGAAAVLLLAYDADYPQPLRAARGIPDAFGVAMLLLPVQSRDQRSIARLRLHLSDAAPSLLGLAPLEAMRRSIPAARSLPLLHSLANRREGVVVLDYLDSNRLSIEVGG